LSYIKNKEKLTISQLLSATNTGKKKKDYLLLRRRRYLQLIDTAVVRFEVPATLVFRIQIS